MNEQDAGSDGADEGEDDGAWDAVEVMRRRARETRVTRDAAVAALRDETNDEAIRDEFGIDLREIEG